MITMTIDGKERKNFDLSSKEAINKAYDLTGKAELEDKYYVITDISHPYIQCDDITSLDEVVWLQIQINSLSPLKNRMFNILMSAGIESPMDVILRLKNEKYSIVRPDDEDEINYTAVCSQTTIFAIY